MSDTEQEFFCGYVIEFSDGGEPEGEILHRGDKESCEELMSVIPAISYSGNRPVKRCFMKMVPVPMPPKPDTSDE